MAAWLVLGLVPVAILESTATLPEGLPAGIWFFGILLGWFVDGFRMDRWTRELQKIRDEADNKLELENMVEALTLPLMRAAQKHGGKLTVAEGVLATGLSITEAEAVLMEMAKTGYVRIENTDRGDLLFDFGDLPEYDEAEAAYEAEMGARELAVEDAGLMVEEEREQAARDQRSAALKGGMAAGVASVGVSALLGALLGDDE